MKKTAVTICLVLVQSAVGLTPMGPPKAANETVISFNYLHSSQDVKIGGYGLSETENIEVDAGLLGFDFGIGKDWQMTLFAGLGNIDAEGFDSSGVIGGIGIKNTFAQQNDVTWGFTGQGFYSDFAEDVTLESQFEVTVDFSYYEMQIAFGPTYEKDDWQIYGGPFLYFLNGSIEFVVGNEWLEPSFDVEKKLNVGGYVGFTKILSENTSINVEVQFMEDSHAMVVRCGYRF